MKYRSAWLAAVGGLLMSAVLSAGQLADPAEPSGTTQAPPMLNMDNFPLKTGPDAPIAGRVGAPALGLAFTRPESWRADDVRWREMTIAQLPEVQAIAEAAGVLELVAADGSVEPLLTLYRVPLVAWRDADRQGKAGPGRIAITTGDKGFVVVRPGEEPGSARFEALRDGIYDAIGSIVLYDPEVEEPNRDAQMIGAYGGKLANGQPISIRLDSPTGLQVSWGSKAQTSSGFWFHTDSLVTMQLADAKGKLGTLMLMHFDGAGFVVIEWDEALFGKSGIRLEKAR